MSKSRERRLKVQMEGDYAYCHWCDEKDIYKDDWDTHWMVCKKHPATAHIKSIRVTMNNYLAAWLHLSMMMRQSYNYGDYCYWCHRSVKGTDESHADDCAFIEALATQGESYEAYVQQFRMKEEMGSDDEAV